MGETMDGLATGHRILVMSNEEFYPVELLHLPRVRVQELNLSQPRITEATGALFVFHELANFLKGPVAKVKGRVNSIAQQSRHDTFGSVFKLRRERRNRGTSMAESVGKRRGPTQNIKPT